MPHDDRPFRDRITHKLPPHLAGWQLPSDWTWGSEGVEGEYRHYQELVDGLGRSLSLVSVPTRCTKSGSSRRRAASRT